MRVLLLSDQGPFLAGQEVDYDDVSAAHLLGSGEAEAAGPPAGFDPSGHTVDDVLAHLEDASDAEVDRVLSLERAGKARVGVLGDDA